MGAKLAGTASLRGSAFVWTLSRGSCRWAAEELNAVSKNRSKPAAHQNTERKTLFIASPT
jgi:hypothetical protein